MIWNLILRSALSVCTASEKAPTIVAGTERIALVGEVGLAEQVTHAAIQDRELVVAQVLDHARDVAGEDGLVHRRGLDQRELGRVDLGEIGLRRAILPAMRSSISFFSWRSNSAISAGRSPFSVPRASRKSCCSSRMSVLLARSISRSPTRSRICANDAVSRCTARSRHSCRIFAISRAGCGRALASVEGAFTSVRGVVRTRE